MATWTTTEPALATEVGAGLEFIRENWEVLAAAWNNEHATLTATGAGLSHTMVTLAVASTATHAANTIILNAVDISNGTANKAEVHAEHEDNQNIQITASDGTRYGLCGKQSMVLSTDDSNLNLGTTDGTTAFKINDSANTNVASIDSDGRIAMAQATAPTVTAGGALYVDTSDEIHFVNSASNTTLSSKTVAFVSWTTPTTLANAYNVASVAATHQASSNVDYLTVTFSTALADTNYTVIATTRNSHGACVTGLITKATDTVKIYFEKQKTPSADGGSYIVRHASTLVSAEIAVFKT